MISGSSNPTQHLAATLGRLGSAFQRVQKVTTPLATGPQINRDTDTPAGLISAENLSAVLEALESEAYVLRRVETIAHTADGYLAVASDLLDDNESIVIQLTNPTMRASGQARMLRDQAAANRQAVARITSTAAFAGVKLFDGRYTLRVGGGRLDLPNLTNAPPTLHALAALREQVHAFKNDVVARRLEVVQATIMSTAQTRSMIRDTDFVRYTAQPTHAPMLSDATIAAIAGPATSPPGVGGILDVRA